MRKRIRETGKRRDFTIQLSKHCVREITAQGYSFDEMLLALNKASYHTHIQFGKDGQKELRVPAIRGRIILDKTRTVGITYIPNCGMKAAVFGHKFDARYSSWFDLSRVFEDGDWMRLHKNGNKLTIIRNSRAMGYLDCDWISGYEKDWTTALGKIYPSEMKGKKWFVEVNSNTDRNGARLIIKDYYDLSSGKMKTKEDNDYRKSNPDHYDW